MEGEAYQLSRRLQQLLWHLEVPAQRLSSKVQLHAKVQPRELQTPPQQPSPWTVRVIRLQLHSAAGAVVWQGQSTGGIVQLLIMQHAAARLCCRDGE